MRWVSLIAGVVVCVGILVAFQNCQPMGQAINHSLLDTTSGGNNNPPPSSLSEAETFFQNSVRPTFQNRCLTCHNEPRFVTGQPGPLTIYNYTLMRAMLAQGGGMTDNNLIRKVTNVTTHTGGDMCPLGVTANDEVCGKIIGWWVKEFPTAPGGLAGSVTSISGSGLVSGWARNPVAPENKVQVFFYRDNPADQGGLLLGSVFADLNDLGPYSGHYFRFSIPSEHIDNQSHTLFVYMNELTADNLIPGSPFTYASFQQTADGIAHYNANMKNTIDTQCNSCHFFDRESAFTNLVTPSPFNGGTTTNNNLIENARGQNHPFNGCSGGINSGLCAAIQQWWNIQFGNP